MKIIYQQSLKEMNVSDEKIKNIIISIFKEKFGFLSRRNYLRWINERTMSSRIKNITAKMMDEEEKAKNPNAAAFYTRGTDMVTMDEDFVDDMSTWDHEFNHFLSDGTGANVLDTFINEGITQFLSEENITNARKTYILNVKFVRLLYRIFGDEVVKTYLTGDPTLIIKIQRYIGNPIDVFNKCAMKVHGFNPDYKSKEYKDALEEFGALTKSLVLSAIKEEMLDFKYYSAGEINFELLRKEVLNFTNIYSQMFMVDKDEFIKECLVTAISNSYFYSKMKPTEIESIVNKSVHNNDISLDYFNKLDYKSDVKENLYLAANLKLNNTNYLENGTFDMTSFLLDFYTLVNNNNFKLSESERTQLLYETLFKRFNLKVDVNALNSILDKYGEFYSHLADLRLENRSTTSESVFFRLNGNSYFEKVDNKFYFVKYDEKTKEFIRKGVGFSDISHNPKYPYQISYIDRSLKSSHEYRILFDKYMDKFLIGGEERTSGEGLESVINDTIISDAINFDYNPYIIRVGKNEYSGLALSAENEDEFENRKCFIDYQSLLDDIKYKCTFLKSNNISEFVKQCINKALSKTYGRMPKDEGIIAKICVQCMRYISLNDVSCFEKLNEISAKLIKQFEEYRKSIVPTGAVLIRNDEDHKKFEKIIKEEKEAKVSREASIAAHEFIDENYEGFIMEKRQPTVRVSDYTYGINGVRLLRNNDFEMPCARKIDFKMLIDAIKERTKDVLPSEKEEYLKKYVEVFIDKIVGFYLYTDSKYNTVFDDLDFELRDSINNCLLNNSEVNNDSLNEILNKINKLFDNEEAIKSSLSSQRLVFASPQDKKIYDSIKAIVSNSKMSEEEKMIRIESLRELANIKEDETLISMINREINKRHRSNEPLQGVMKVR